MTFGYCSQHSQGSQTTGSEHHVFDRGSEVKQVSTASTPPAIAGRGELPGGHIAPDERIHHCPELCGQTAASVSWSCYGVCKR